MIWDMRVGGLRKWRPNLVRRFRPPGHPYPWSEGKHTRETGGAASYRAGPPLRLIPTRGLKVPMPDGNSCGSVEPERLH